MSSVAWSNLANDRLGEAPNTAAGAALTNTTAETIISPGPDLTFNPGELRTGKVLRVRACGEFNAPGSPSTLQVRLRYGGTGGVALADTGAITPIASASHATFEVEVLIAVRAAGASGSAMAIGKALGLTAVGSVAQLPATTPATATIDTTTSKTLTLTGQWGTAASTYSITVHLWTVEELN